MNAREEETNAAPHAVAVASHPTDVAVNANCVPVATSTSPQLRALGNRNPEGQVSCRVLEAVIAEFIVKTNVLLELADGRESDRVSDRELTCRPLVGAAPVYSTFAQSAVTFFRKPDPLSA